MCELCRRNPCPCSCPNFRPQFHVFCIECYEGISQGEEYLEADGGPVCLDCLEHMGSAAALKLVGIGLERA